MHDYSIELSLRLTPCEKVVLVEVTYVFSCQPTCRLGGTRTLLFVWHITSLTLQLVLVN